jgi:hypothetical protein
VCLGLIGCSTPRSTLDAANNTAALVGEMDKELREFRRVQAGFDRQRKELIRQQAQAISLNESVIAENELFGAATIAGPVQAAERSIREMTIGLAQIDSQAEADLAAVDKQLEELTLPLPATTDNAVAVQKALVLLGTELPVRVRFAEFRSLAQTVREGVAKNKQKIKDAEQAAAPKEGQ